MNKHLYRIVFNRSLGLFQVVAEIARSYGRNGARNGHATAATSRFAATLGRLRFALMLALGQAVIVPSTWAQIVADPNAPGNQRPTVLEAANGVPLVNIQTPSAAGVSRNTYKQFDVDPQGAILNNARTSTQTQLGGWVQGNPWLARGTARVILNEVNSSDPSQLRGYVEVAGDRAQLVIANPAGIACDGCGFINAHRATLTTGEPIVNGGSLEAYRVRSGTVQIGGKGMDASAANYTDVIARSVQVNASIWAQQLEVTTGANDVSADHTQVQQVATTDTAPAFALDVGALGGMYAQKIVMVGTEHGVGVRNAGTLGAQIGQLVVTADGRLENSGTMQAKTDTRIAASGGVTNAGTISAARELALNTPQDVDNSQGILNARRIDVTAQSLTNRAGAIEQTGTQDLALSTASLSNRNGGRIGLAPADVAVGDTQMPGDGHPPKPGASAPNTDNDGDTSDHRDNQPDADLAPLADGSLNIAATLNNDEGRIVAGGDIDLMAAADLDNADGHLGVRRLDVRGGTLNNRAGELKVAANMNIVATRIDNDAGQMFVAGPVAVQVQDFSNRAGTFAHSSDTQTRLTITGQLDNHAGTLASNASRLTLDAGQLINTEGHITHAGEEDLVITARTFSGAGGKTATAGAAHLRLGASDHRNAILQAQQIVLDAQSLDNRGGQVIATGETANRIAVAGVLDNREDGAFVSQADLDMYAHTLDNRSGSVASNGAVNLRAQSLHNQAGNIVAAGTTIQADTVINQNGTVVATEAALHIKVDNRFDNAHGTLAAGGDMAVHAAALDNQAGTLIASGSDALQLHVRDHINNAGGTIASNGALDLRTDELNNRAGSMQAAGDGATHINVAHVLDNTDGTLAAAGDVLVKAGAFHNRGGDLVSQADLSVQAATLDNRAGGLIVSTGGGLRVDTQGRTENAGGTLQGAGDVNLSNTGLDNTNGTVLGANTAIDTRRAALDNTGGTIASTRGLLNVHSGALHNAGGLLQSAQAMHLNTHGQALINTDAGDTGGILSGGTLVLDSASLDNRDGILHSQGDLTARIDTMTNTAGQLGSNHHVTLTVTSLANSNGIIQAGKDLSAHVSGAVNNSGLMVAGDGLTLDAAQILNRDTLLAGQSLDVRAANIDNTTTGKIQGERTAVTARDTLTNRGLIDGARTRIEADRLDNVGTGRIYGDHLAIQADTIHNREEGAGADQQAGVIAARERLDIGAKAIHNREQALIFSAGTGSDALNIGGALDANGQALGRADQVLNASAIIESLGGLTINSTEVLNHNLHFGTELVQIGDPTKFFYLQPKGSPDKLDASEFRWEGWSRAGRYRHKSGWELRAWTQYNVTQTEYQTQVTESAPALIRAGGDMRLRGDTLINDKSQIIAGGTLQGDLDRLENVAAFGEHITRQTGTSQYTHSRWRGGFRRYHQREWDRVIAYTPADIVQTIDLDVSKVLQHTADGGSGFAVDTRQTAQVDDATGGARQRQIIAVAVQPDLDAATRAQVDGIDADLTKGRGMADSQAPTVIRSIQVDTDIPASSLFFARPAADGYLIETDPRFASYRNWLSSDYLLAQLGLEPNAVQKRLGDGFYEQKLVREQIGQLTGRRFLDGYADDEAQYRALLEAGSTFAQAWDLRPGVALSAEQMAQLTSDIVWLVERDVRLPDGTATRALVPQVYVRVKPGDMNGNGTLLAANNIDLNLTADGVNSGTIAGRSAVQLTGENLRNLNGRITGNAVALTARTDMDNIGGTVDAGKALLVNAGRDLNVATTTHSDAKQAGRSDFSRSNIDRIAGLYITGTDGILLAAAERDVNLMAAQIVSTGVDGQTAILAGRDLTLGTVQIAEQENNVRNANNYLRQGFVQDVGTRIAAVGDVRLQAGGGLNATAASVRSETGALAAVADGDVNILAGEVDSNWSEGRQHTSRSLLGSSRRTSRDSLEETRALASTFSGSTVAVQGQNVTLSGSNVVSDFGTVVVADQDITLQAASEARNESHFKETKKSGLLYNGGLSVTLGSQMQSGGRKDVGTQAAAATVGSTEGDVMLLAGERYQQTGSHVLAPQGDIDIHARTVDIVEAREAGISTQEQKFRQSGLTVALSSPVLSAIETGRQMQRAASATSDSRMQALASVTTGMAAVNAYDAVRANPKTGGGVNISVTLGTSKSASQSTRTHDMAAGSTVAAGGDVRISATGAGADSNLTVRGSNVSAGGNAHLLAEGDINLLAAHNSVETRRRSSSSSAGVGVAVSVGGGGGVAAGITVNASRGKGKGEGQDRTWTHTHVTAGERLTLESGGDTTLRGAIVSGQQVVADVGGNLNIESLQDSSTFRSRDRNIGGSVTVGYGFAAGSANFGQQKIDSDYASVTEQSRIEAGDGGFQIRVAGNTDLKGAAITSTEQAVQDGVNTLSTATLTASDITNRAEYEASSVSVGLGYAKKDDKSAAGGDVGTNQQGQVATGGDQIPGTTLPSLGNFSASPPMVMAASGDSSSVTRSGISAAQITLTDEAAQQALTGHSAQERITSLNRDVHTGQDGANALKPIFNEQEIKAGFEIVAALQRETGTFLNNRAKEAVAAQQALDQERAKPEAERNPALLAALEQRVNASAIWAPGGTGRQVLTALAAAAGGNVTGASSQFAQALVVNYLQQQGAAYIGDLVRKGTLTEGSPAHATLHAIVACAGAMAGSQDCASGALGAAASSLLTNLFLDTPNESAEQKEAKRNLIATLVTGIAATGGLNVATATNSAIAAVDNNYLTQYHIDKLRPCLSGKTCSPAEQKTAVEEAEKLSEFLDAELNKLCAANPVSDACRTAVNAATQYIAIQEAWQLVNGDVTRSSRNIFDYVYNSLGAESRFALYYNTIDNKANFFGASDRYEQNIGSGAKWFEGAEFVSRAGLTGLGADGHGSAYTFFAGSLFAYPPSVYDWRQEAGDALMKAGFDNFKELYNNKILDPTNWDINQLKSEQTTLQSIHEKYLADKWFFPTISKWLTSSSSLGYFLDEKKTQPGGINILDYNSRVEYGCKLLGYSQSQGCKP